MEVKEIMLVFEKKNTLDNMHCIKFNDEYIWSLGIF